MMERVSDYRINNTTLRVAYGDITLVPADAIVSSDDNYLSMSGGVSASIVRAGGEIIRAEARKHVPLAIGDVAVTSAGGLPAKYVFHAVTIDYDKMIYASEQTVMDATRQCLQLADTLRINRIAFPALGTGVAGFLFHLAAEVMVRTIAEYLAGETAIDLVVVTLFAREGVTLGNLNEFYERAVAVASLSTQAKRLGILMTELQHVVDGLKDTSLYRRVLDLRADLERAELVFAARSDSIEQLDRIQDKSRIGDLSRLVVDVSGETQASSVWDDKQLEATVLRTQMAGLQTQLNIQTGNLNRYQIERAKYGAMGPIPPRLENAIADVEAEIQQLTQHAQRVRVQLLSLGGDQRA